MPHPVFSNICKVNTKFGPYIDKIGLEIEGGWICQDGYRGGNLVAHNQNVIFDRSVRFRRRARNAEEQELDACFVAGEVNSQPFPDFSGVNEFLNLYWPDQTNATCGFHIHASFKDEDYYNMLMHTDFYHKFKAELNIIQNKLKLGATTKRRIEGKNRFCKDEWRPLHQKRSDEKYNPFRYAMINFCWNVHRTMEVRVFSSHIPRDKSFNIVKWWVDLINGYLSERVSPYHAPVNDDTVRSPRRRSVRTFNIAAEPPEWNNEPELEFNEVSAATVARPTISISDILNGGSLSDYLHTSVYNTSVQDAI